MALGPWARADDLRRLESQIGQVNDRLDFIYSMRPFMEQIKEYFQNVECEASVQMRRLKNVHVAHQGSDDPAEEIVKWLHFVTNWVMACNVPATLVSSQPEPSAEPARDPPDTLPVFGVGLGPGQKARPVLLERSRMSSSDISQSQDRYKNDAAPPRSCTPSTAVRGSESHRFDVSQQRLQIPQREVPRARSPIDGSSTRVDRAQAPTSPSRTMPFHPDPRSMVNQVAAVSSTSATKLFATTDANTHLSPYDSARETPPRTPKTPRDWGTGTSASGLDLVTDGLVQPSSERPEFAFGGPVEQQSLSGLMLGKGDWAHAYRRSQGTRRDAMRLLCMSGIVTERELSDDLTVISEEHIDECVQIATEMLQMKSMEAWAQQPQDANKCFEAKLTALYSARFAA